MGCFLAPNMICSMHIRRTTYSFPRPPPSPDWGRNETAGDSPLDNPMMTPSENTLAGYAGIVSNILYPLNENRKFQKYFRHKKLKFLLNSPGWVYAALVIIEKGTIRVEGIKNRPAEKIHRDVLRWNGYLEMDTLLYSAVLTKRKSLMELAKAWLKGEIRLKGMLSLPYLIRLFRCLSREKLLYSPRTEYDDNPGT
jgi:hypothetical protein